MARILFIDDRMEEILRQWSQSGCASRHELLPLQPFASIEQACHLVEDLRPDVIVIGFGLGVREVTGVDVVKALRERGYDGAVIANSGGGPGPFVEAGLSIQGNINRQPRALKEALDQGEQR